MWACFRSRPRAPWLRVQPSFPFSGLASPEAAREDHIRTFIPGELWVQAGGGPDGPGLRTALCLGNAREESEFEVVSSIASTLIADAANPQRAPTRDRANTLASVYSFLLSVLFCREGSGLTVRDGGTWEPGQNNFVSLGFPLCEMGLTQGHRRDER